MRTFAAGLCFILGSYAQAADFSPSYADLPDDKLFNLALDEGIGNCRISDARACAHCVCQYYLKVIGSTWNGGGWPLNTVSCDSTGCISGTQWSGYTSSMATGDLKHNGAEQLRDALRSPESPCNPKNNSEKVIASLSCGGDRRGSFGNGVVGNGSGKSGAAPTPQAEAEVQGPIGSFAGQPMFKMIVKESAEPISAPKNANSNIWSNPLTITPSSGGSDKPSRVHVFTFHRKPAEVAGPNLLEVTVKPDAPKTMPANPVQPVAPEPLM